MPRLKRPRAVYGKGNPRGGLTEAAHAVLAPKVRTPYDPCLFCGEELIPQPQHICPQMQAHARRTPLGCMAAPEVHRGRRCLPTCAVLPLQPGERWAPDYFKQGAISWVEPKGRDR